MQTSSTEPNVPSGSGETAAAAPAATSVSPTGKPVARKRPAAKAATPGVDRLPATRVKSAGAARKIPAKPLAHAFAPPPESVPATTAIAPKSAKTTTKPAAKVPARADQKNAKPTKPAQSATVGTAAKAKTAKALRKRAAALKLKIKRSGLVRAGLKALSSLSDEALTAALAGFHDLSKPKGKKSAAKAAKKQP